MERLFHMTTSFQKMVRQMTKTEQAAAALLLRDATDAATEEAYGMLPKEDSARKLHMAVDAALERSMGQQGSQAEEIRCQKRCCHCCKQLVAITEAEAALLVQSAARAGVPIPMTRLSRQVGRTEASWRDLGQEDRSCIFLQADGTCAVYADRPASCRKYFVLDAPDLCNIERYPNQDVRVWVSFGAELETSAAFSARPTGPMPEMLIAELAKAGKEEVHGKMAHGR